MRFFLCFIVIFCSACTSVPGEKPLEMPEEYLGYWEPYTKTLAGIGIDIRPDAIYHINDPKYYADSNPGIPGKIRYIEHYKVIHTDETHVYLIKEDRHSTGWYEYISFSIQPESPYLSFIKLYVSVTDECNLREADWNLPVEFHRQHILNNTCPDPSITLRENSFRDLSYGYVRDKEPKEKN